MSRWGRAGRAERKRSGMRVKSPAGKSDGGVKCYGWLMGLFRGGGGCDFSVIAVVWFPSLFWFIRRYINMIYLMNTLETLV